jgi:hypothetical protein
MNCSPCTATGEMISSMVIQIVVQFFAFLDGADLFDHDSVG